MEGAKSGFWYRIEVMSGLICLVLVLFACLSSLADFGTIIAFFFHPTNVTFTTNRSIQDLCEWG